MAWNNKCKPFSHGGLGLGSLTMLNEACNIKLDRDMVFSREQWTYILKSKVLKGYGTINYHILLFIWSFIKADVC